MHFLRDGSELSSKLIVGRDHEHLSTFGTREMTSDPTHASKKGIAKFRKSDIRSQIQIIEWETQFWRNQWSWYLKHKEVHLKKDIIYSRLKLQVFLKGQLQQWPPLALLSIILIKKYGMLCVFSCYCWRDLSASGQCLLPEASDDPAPCPDAFLVSILSSPKM